ncbi:MAG TPA: PEP-CTERM sorting domain-containing protein [Isosphaeraceae bacterium]|nr:PEP-CTERM sorting domain-containing protein [Isosphaeraceae bacterium]
MRSRLVGLAGGMLAAATFVFAPLAVRADTIPSPAFQVTDLGVGQTNGINNAGVIYGSTQGQAYTAQANDLGSSSQPLTDPKVVDTNLGTGYNIAYGVNTAGQVVGSLQVTSGNASYQQAFVETNGHVTTIPTLGGNYGGAHGINSFGQVVGSAQTSNGTEQAFIYNPTTGTTSSLGTFGGKNSDARAINDAGKIVGSAQTASGNWNAFTATANGQLQNLGTLAGGSNSWAFTVNSKGTVVGASDTSAGAATHAVYWQNGQIHDLGTLGTASYATGINSSGEIVGWNTDSNGNYSAFLWDGTKMVDLNTYNPAGSPFTSLSGATGINDAGQIVGWGVYSNGSQHSFLLTPTTNPSDGYTGGGTDPGNPNPIPEPSTLAILGLAAAVEGVRRYRSRRQG